MYAAVANKSFRDTPKLRVMQGIEKKIKCSKIILFSFELKTVKFKSQAHLSFCLDGFTMNRLRYFLNKNR